MAIVLTGYLPSFLPRLLPLLKAPMFTIDLLSTIPTMAIPDHIGPGNNGSARLTFSHCMASMRYLSTPVLRPCISRLSAGFNYRIRNCVIGFRHLHTNHGGYWKTCQVG